jgi:uridine kinase
MSPVRDASNPLLVAIAGGTGSGKTTIASAVAYRLGRERVSVLSHDAYYRDRSYLPAEQRGVLNYDVPEAFDVPLFVEHLRALRAGLPVEAPVYSFASHTRTAETRVIAPREIVLVEGLLVLHEPAVRELLDLAIFLDAPATVRLGRRLHRDIAERGRTALAVLEQFHGTVQPAHVEYVEPTKKFADLVLPNVDRIEECVNTAVQAIASRAHRSAAPRRMSTTSLTVPPMTIAVPSQERR